jgi:hypothetical protein|tara:strand:- start:90 stop:437 length:348 start_codon:yes stop_codon:yes gene_type:complete
MDKEEWEKIRKQAKFEKPYEFLKDQDCSQCDKKTKDHSFEELNHCIKGRESLKHICHNCNKKISEHTDEEKILCLAELSKTITSLEDRLHSKERDLNAAKSFDSRSQPYEHWRYK